MATNTHLRCADCHEPARGALWVCPACSSVVHSECAAEFGGCPSIGCEEKPPPPPPARGLHSGLGKAIGWVREIWRGNRLLLCSLVFGPSALVLLHFAQLISEDAPPPLEIKGTWELGRSIELYQEDEGRLPAGLWELRLRGTQDTQRRPITLWRTDEGDVFGHTPALEGSPPRIFVFGSLSDPAAKEAAVHVAAFLKVQPQVVFLHDTPFTRNP